MKDIPTALPERRVRTLVRRARAWLARPRARPLFLGLSMGSCLSLWAALVVLVRGREVLEGSGYTLGSITLAYLCVSLMGGAAVSLFQPLVARSGFAPVLLGAVIGAFGVPAFVLPAMSGKEWLELLPWSVALGVFGGVYAAVRFRTELSSERDGDPEE
jgi:hypothetical protein